MLLLQYSISIKIKWNLKSLESKWTCYYSYRIEENRRISEKKKKRLKLLMQIGRVEKNFAD